jgi:hypothetical protein
VASSDMAGIIPQATASGSPVEEQDAGVRQRSVPWKPPHLRFGQEGERLGRGNPRAPASDDEEAQGGLSRTRSLSVLDAGAGDSRISVYILGG